MTGPTQRIRLPWLAAGLGCITLATLMLEVLDTRLLSVLAWYHLSFLAISVAMLGMAAGAVLVFAAGRRAVATLLPWATIGLALTIVASHVASLSIPFPPVRAVVLPDVVSLAVATAVLTLPFIVSGIVVTLALTRTDAPIGVLYGADLLGAAAGCLAVIGLLNVTDLSSIVLLIGGIAAFGAACFACALRSSRRAAIVLTAVCVALSWGNAHADHRLGVQYPKNRSVWPLLDTVQYSAWNSHSYVIVRRPEPARAWMWGPGTHAPDVPAIVSWAMIDGEAGTPITKWNGDPAALSWVTFDVTSLPYRLRHGGVGIIGVGGGRDVLTAIGTGNTPITGIEINRTFVDLLTGPFRDFAGIAGRPGVSIVHDEARSYLTRTPERFDVLQMSLIDTWAATGAGAFTLTENGLYTREAWRIFLRSLAPAGIFSVSRWYAPGAISETTRLVSLATAALLDAHVADPSRHLIVASAGRIATLLVSPTPFSEADRRVLETSARDAGFDIVLSPWSQASSPRLGAVATSRTFDELARATADRDFDFSPPSDARPFFFNVLKLGAWRRLAQVPSGGVVEGNLVATATLFALLSVVVVLVLLILIWPLTAIGRPSMPAGVFGWSLLYFSLIGCGFMFIQMPLLQRFSVYLGHPTYTFSIVLFLMILAAGGGSLSSTAISIDRPALTWLPIAVGIAIAGETLVIQAAVNATQAWSLIGRTAVVALFTVPLSWALGVWFPIGMRLTGRHAPQVTAWMWGVNGACGVIASIVAVVVSIWSAVETNLFVAAGLYVLLAWPLGRLRARA